MIQIKLIQNKNEGIIAINRNIGLRNAKYNIIAFCDDDDIWHKDKLRKQIEYINQNPIGTSSRSNPATYIKAYDDIRNLFSLQKTAKQFSLKPKHFSFNVDGGRCDECKGEGEIKIEMRPGIEENVVFKLPKELVNQRVAN